MGKIKGWRKVIDNKKTLQYISDKDRVLTSLKIGSKTYPYEIGLAYSSKSFPNIIHKASYKESAKDYMINYMRRHPNG